MVEPTSSLLVLMPGTSALFCRALSDLGISCLRKLLLPDFNLSTLRSLILMLTVSLTLRLRIQALRTIQLRASLSILLNNSVSPGTFLPATNYATGSRSHSVSFGDLNGDRNVDVVVANTGSLGDTGSVSILFQDPGRPGIFRTAVNRPGTSQPLGVTIIDLNGDTFPDIALADDGVRILFQIPAQPGNFQSPILVGS